MVRVPWLSRIHSPHFTHPSLGEGPLEVLWKSLPGHLRVSVVHMDDLFVRNRICGIWEYDGRIVFACMRWPENELPDSRVVHSNEAYVADRGRRGRGGLDKRGLAEEVAKERY